MRRKIVAGNWKMNGLTESIIQLVTLLKSQINAETVPEVLLMPPAIYLPLVNQLLENSGIALGAQNIYPKNSGAYTGEISALMVKEFNCKYVLVGHSERRHLFKEDEKFIAQKFHQIKEHGMIPVLCVGETLNERENGHTEQIIAKQLLSVCEDNDKCFEDCIIAYEPVWAIGTGKTASPDQAQEVHQFIRELVAKVSSNDAAELSILYGGSVNGHNAESLFSMPDIDGGLVGGASLEAKQFLEIVKCIN